MSTGDTWQHLKGFGYAPGYYMNTCHRCENVVSDVDKRAITCRPCAEQLLIESQAAQIAAFKTVMVAAAEEIAAHWNAHCDAEGYGPQNLLRRLEEGIPSEYGYTAGAFAALTAERDALRAYYRASKNLQLTVGHPDATAQDEQAAEDAYAKASSDAARIQAHKPASKGQTADTPPAD